MYKNIIHIVRAAFVERFSLIASSRHFVSNFKRSVDPSNGALLAFFAGVCLPMTQVELIDISFLLGAAAILFVLCFKFRIILYALFFVLGLSWASFCFTNQIQASYPSKLERQSVLVEGRILGIPSNQGGDLKFEFLVERANQIDGLPIGSLADRRLLLSCYRCKLTIVPKQRWRLTVRLKRPHGYASWGAFDYEQYLFRKRIVAKGYVRLKEHNQLLGRDTGGIDNWRWEIGQKIRQLSAREGRINDTDIHSSPYSNYVAKPLSTGFAVILALAIGDKSALSKGDRRVFQDTGVSHLMAISGLHVGLVFVGVGSVFGWLLLPFARIFERVPKQHLVLLPALGSAFLYSALAGFAVSTQRALIMLSVYVMCRLLVRDVSLLKVLLISACLIVLISPWSVLDIGFWLSCGAVFIIALVSRRGSYEDKESLSLIRLQPALWLGMSPMSVLFFGQVSLISPLVNLVMVPLFCVILIPITLIAVLLQQLGMADGLLHILSYCFESIFFVLEWLSQLPFAKWYSTPWPWASWLVAMLALLIVFSVLSLRVKVILGLACVLFIVFNPSDRLQHDDLDLVLLDVGQGLAIVLLSPEYVLVYDTGPRYGTGFNAAEAVVVPYLRSRGVNKIDTLIISHADNDHIGGYEMVVNSFEVGEVMTSRVDKLPSATECLAGQYWQEGGTQYSMISPDRDTPQGSNNRSCVLRIEHFGTRVLITGDIEKQVERYLLETKAEHLGADILLVPHQGSKTSSTQAFIDVVQPTIALIAAGYGNHYGHPHHDVVNRYSDRNVDLVSTIDNGSVLLKLNQAGWHRVSYRDRERRFWFHQKKPNWDG